MKKLIVIAIIAFTLGLLCGGIPSVGAHLEQVSWRGPAAGSGDTVTGPSANAPAGGVFPTSWFETRPASFADLAERVQGAVVNISTTKKSRAPQFMTPFPRNGPRDPFDDFFEKFFEGQPQERTQNSLGSGFIVSKDGTILTNNHVVSQADEIQVEISDGRKFKAKIVGKDERTDIAVIRIDGKGDLPTVPLGDSDAMRPGDWTMAIGNPFGLEHTVTVGVVSAKGRLLGGGPYAKFIQTDASINPGNSGGPLFNLKGEVIGINTMIFAGGQGIGFAIPINLAKDLMPQLLAKGSVTRGWLGVSIQEITPELAKAFNLSTEKGALIAEVFPDSPAGAAGLKRGDVVIEFNGQKVEAPYDLSLLVGKTEVDKSVKLKVLREGKEFDAEVKVGKAVGEGEEATAPTGEREERGKADLLGLVVKGITPNEAMQLDLPSGFKGVVVARVEPGSSAEASEIKSGDVILELNGKKIESVVEYKAVSTAIKEGDYARLLIKRGQASVYLAFKVTK